MADTIDAPAVEEGSQTAATIGSGSASVRILGYEQVRRLSRVVSSKMAIPGRGNYPKLEMTTRQLVLAVRDKLEADGIQVSSVQACYIGWT